MTSVMCTDLTISVKILPYRLPAQLIRAKYLLPVGDRINGISLCSARRIFSFHHITESGVLLIVNGCKMLSFLSLRLRIAIVSLRNITELLVL